MLVYSLELVYKILDLNETELSDIKESMEFIRPQVLLLCSNLKGKRGFLIYENKSFRRS